MLHKYTTLPVHVFHTVREKARPSHCSYVRRKAIRKSPAIVVFPCGLKAIGSVLALVLFSRAAQSYKNGSCARATPMWTQAIGTPLLNQRADQDPTVSSLLQTQNRD